MINVRILFQLNILLTNAWNLTNICVCSDINKIKVSIGMHDFFAKNAAEFWPLISFYFYAHLTFLQHEKCCSWAIIRFSDSSSLSLSNYLMFKIISQQK